MNNNCIILPNITLWKYMLIKKVCLIIWNDRYDNPFRIIEKSYARYRKYGWIGTVDRLNREYSKINLHEVNHLNKKSDYKIWIENNELDILDVERLEYNPLLSIITPTYNTDKKYLVEMIESVLSQTYANWELCMADDASVDKETLNTLQKYQNRYQNIKIIFRKKNGHISEASNSALGLATGKYILFLDHDDTLAPNALYEMVKRLNINPKLKLIYSDEDKIDEDSKRFNPHFKSGWNPDMFFSQNYICHFVIVQKRIVDAVQGLRVGYEGSQDYDFLLRCLNHLKDEEIGRVEKILYHWRAIEGSTAYGSGEKDYAHEAGLKALEDYFSDKDAEVKVEDGLLPNTYKVNYLLPTENLPLVSLLIPTRDGYDILHKCVDSILEKTLYKNYEIIVLDNETTCKKTLEYFDKIKKHDNVSVLEYHYPFNYSAINNFGVKYAKGEIVGLINNDVEVISEGWLSEMVSHAMRKEIGAVGAMLYYDNDTIQHAGVIGVWGGAGHSHKYFKRGDDGYLNRLKVIQNYSAVTAACLIVKKEIYQEVNGLNEENLKVAFNDVDLCLKIQERGYRNLWTPYVELYHHESISRGGEDNPEKIERFNKEVDFMKDRWFNALSSDLYYNCNLTNKHENFGLNINE